VLVYFFAGLGIFTFLVVVAGFILPHGVWGVNILFEKLNHFHWYLQNPFRGAYKDFNTNPNTRKRARLLFKVFYIVRVPYLLAIWIILFPLRIILAFYYDILLFYSLTIKDSVLTWMGYKLDSNLNKYSVKAFYYWVVRFFQELPNFIGKLLKMVFQGIAMFVLDCAIPALTVYHGTSKTAVDAITSEGQWISGQGDFGGLGIYFGLNKYVAHHYGDRNHGRVILARVSTPLIRSLASIPEKIKIAQNRYDKFIYPMQGGQGHLISSFLKSRPSSISELWRTKTPHQLPHIKGWYELCVLSENRGKKESYWRIRAIGGLNENGHGLDILHNGIQFWPFTVEDWTFLGLSLMLCTFLFYSWFEIIIPHL